MTHGFQASSVRSIAAGCPCRSTNPRPNEASRNCHSRTRTREKKGPPLPFHPCMHELAHHQIPRLHLPVAMKCNTRCGYCERRIAPLEATVVEPGLSGTLLSPDQALVKTRRFLDRWGKNSVVGIAGPGEPLANRETLETLRLIRREYPAVTLCVCTNGLNLPDHCGELRELEVKHLSVTINGFDPQVVARIQPSVNKDDRVYVGTRAAEVLIQNQEAGVEAAVASGMVVKVNYVVVPEINGTAVVSTAQKVKELGARVFNPVPLIPRGLFKDLTRPDDQYMDRVRFLCSRFVPIFRHCRQCRADAEGIPGKEESR